MDLRRILPRITTGAAMPNGSYRLLVTYKTPRLVNGLFPSVTLKVNGSASKSKHTPNDR